MLSACRQFHPDPVTLASLGLIAIQVAKQAGYNVIPPENNPNLLGAERTTPTPAPAPAPKKEEDPYAGYSWSERQAAKYL